jgi:SAM-dependent methyltransferase
MARAGGRDRRVVADRASIDWRTVSTPVSSPFLRSILARPRGYRAARLAFRGLQRGTTGLRRRYYLDARGHALIGRLPDDLRVVVGLDDPTAIGSRRIEIGGGPYAQRGFLHVDIDPGAHHLEWVAPAWELPVPDGWAAEISAIHALEHVEPARLLPTLAEWKRVLEPGGRVQVHVPNGPALMAAFQARPVSEKWPIMGSLLGMYCGPETRDPRELKVRSDHQLIFDEPMLRWALETAGFVRFRDLTGIMEDRHTGPWRDLVSDYSLIAEAVKPA